MFLKTSCFKGEKKLLQIINLDLFSQTNMEIDDKYNTIEQMDDLEPLHIFGKKWIEIKDTTNNDLKNEKSLPDFITKNMINDNCNELIWKIKIVKCQNTINQGANISIGIVRYHNIGLKYSINKDSFCYLGCFGSRKRGLQKDNKNTYGDAIKQNDCIYIIFNVSQQYLQFVKNNICYGNAFDKKSLTHGFYSLFVTLKNQNDKIQMIYQKITY